MMLDGKLIEAVKINSLQVKMAKYLDNIKNELLDKHNGLIKRLQKQPTFFVEVSCNESG